MKQENYLYRILSIDYMADGASAELEFLPECPVYKGHFPGLPITPGVLLLAVVREIVEKIVGTGCEIESVRNVKFLQVLTPDSNPVRVIISGLERIEGTDRTDVTDGIGGIDCTDGIGSESETGRTDVTDDIGGIDCTSGIDRIGKINCIGKIDSTGETDVTGETDSGISGAERSRKIRTIIAKASIVGCRRNEKDGGCGQGEDGHMDSSDGRGSGECTTFAKMSITFKTTRQ